MPISYSEYAGLTCPACGAAFEADVWTLVDSAERSDLAQALADEVLNVVTCPKCGHVWPAGAPLLFHDPANRRVYFAVPPGAEEHAWRARAQELLYLLVGSLPEEQRLPYLGDVQVEQEVAGVRRAILRRERRGRGNRETSRQAKETGRQETSEQERAVDDVRSPASPPAPPSDPTVVEALRALLAADSDTEFAELIAASPQLLGEDVDAIVGRMADLAYEAGQRDMAAALRELRITLARARAGADWRPTLRHGPGQAADDLNPPSDIQPETQPSALNAQPSTLSDAAYQALLRVFSPDALLAAVRDYPALLEQWADDELAARTEAALDEGNERLARQIEAHREALAELRAQVSGYDSLLQAIRVLLAADGEDAVADVISTYPVLLTDAAQDALFGLAADARAQGDQELAEGANSCRALLRTVRAGLEEY
jgi:ribosomal 50S subunit-associated protein YjgA (DUF615 family)